MNDLSSDLLEYIFGFLDLKRLFQVERVSKKWQDCVRKTLEKKTKFPGLFSPFTFLKLDPLLIFESLKGFSFVNQTNIKTLEIILKKCPNIQSIDFERKQIQGKNILLTIGKLCPKLQEINFYEASVDVNDEGVKQFAQMIGPQIIKCKLNLCNLEFTKLMLMHMKNVEKIDFGFEWPECEKQSHYIFTQLKSCEKLKELKCIIDGQKHIDENDDLPCVIQRLEYLKVNLPAIQYFDFGLENLTELKIYYEYYHGYFPNTEINFPNLTRLGIINSEEILNFGFIYEWKMPKLEHVQVKYLNFQDKFFRHIKNIKSFKCSRLDLYQMDQIYRINKELINFQCENIDITSQIDLKNFCDCIDVLIKHKSLQNIKFDYIFEYLYNIELFGKLIELAKSKANVNVTIVIGKNFNEQILEYKKKFEETKLKNLQMKMIFLTRNGNMI